MGDRLKTQHTPPNIHLSAVAFKIEDFGAAIWVKEWTKGVESEIPGACSSLPVHSEPDYEPRAHLSLYSSSFLFGAAQDAARITNMYPRRTPFQSAPDASALFLFSWTHTH